MDGAVAEWHDFFLGATGAGAALAGLLLVAGNADGFYVVGVGIALSYTVAVLNGWVLLIEILR